MKKSFLWQGIGYLPIQAYRIMKKYYDNPPSEDYLYISRKSLIPVILKNKIEFLKLSETTNIYNNTPNDILNYIDGVLDIDEKKLKEKIKEHKISFDKKFEDLNTFNTFVKILVDNFYDEERINSNQEIYRNYFKEIYKGKVATFDIGYSARPEMYISQLCNKEIDTYFCNINGDEALVHAQRGKFKIKCFFDGKPSVTGFSYESVLSALAPSCIKYDISEGKVVPVFEKYDKNYFEEYIIGCMQEAAMMFIKDVTNIFDESIELLYTQRHYISIPILSYINSSRDFDRKIFDDIFFEDDVGMKEHYSLGDLIKKEMKNKNQASLEKLFNIENEERIEKESEEEQPVRKKSFFLFRLLKRDNT